MLFLQEGGAPVFYPAGLQQFETGLPMMFYNIVFLIVNKSRN